MGLRFHCGGKAQIGGQVVNVSATDARTDRSIPGNKRSAGAASGGTKMDMVKAAISPYSDVKYCVGPRIGAICQCGEKFIKREPRERQGKKRIGRRRHTLSSILGAKGYAVVGNAIH